MTVRDIIMSAAGSGIPAGQRTYDVPGTYSFQVPSDTTSISVVCVGGGGGGAHSVANSATTFLMFGAGGGGGALAYVNNISVTPGEFLTVVVGGGGPPSVVFGSRTNGGNSYIERSGTKLCHAGGGQSALRGSESPLTNPVAGLGGSVLLGTGGKGGDGSLGGGGAGGYAGAGGNESASGAGGGGGGGASMNYRAYETSLYIYDVYIGGSGGGGVDVLGQGTSGAAGVRYNYGEASNVYSTGGGGGSGGVDGGQTTSQGGGIGGEYGGGGGGAGGQSRVTKSTGAYTVFSGGGNSGRPGAVRIIWSGTTGITRAFPSTNTGNI